MLNGCKSSKHSFNLEDFDEDKSNDTASSKEPKHSDVASIDDASSYLASHRFPKDNNSHNEDSLVDKMLMDEANTTMCEEDINLNLIINWLGISSP